MLDYKYIGGGGGKGGEGSGTWYLVEPTQKTVSLKNIFLSRNDC